MKITYDKLPEGRSFPLKRDDVKRFVEWVAPPSLLNRLVGIHFGANQRTTQEGRVVARGPIYEIRVNFWLEGDRSKLLSSKPRWIRFIRRFGGEVDMESKVIIWAPDAAARYAGFLIAHEIAHAVYADENSNGRFGRKSGGASEERWCDEWASNAVARLHKCLGQ